MIQHGSGKRGRLSVKNEARKRTAIRGYYRPVRNFKGEDKLVIELLGSDGVKVITVTFVVE